MLIGKTLEDRFTVVREVGKGSFCAVYLALDQSSLKPVAVKVLKPGNPDAAFKREIATLRALKPAMGVPHYLASGTIGLQQFIVMEMLECDMYKIVSKHGPLSVGIVLRIARDTIKALESIHACGYLHLDIKGDNIAVRRKKRNYECCFLDFGLAAKYMISGVHYIYSEESDIRGNPNFSSRNMMAGTRPSRRDDLECLMYTLAYLGNRTLPWIDHGNVSFGCLRAEIAHKKDSFSPEYIFGSLPKELGFILTHVKELNFDEKPDYARYLRLVELAASDNGVKLADSNEWEGLLTCMPTLDCPSPETRILLSDKTRIHGSPCPQEDVLVSNRRQTKRRLTKDMQLLDYTPRRPNRSSVFLKNLHSAEILETQSTTLTDFKGRRDRGKDGTVKTDVTATPKLRSTLAMWRGSEASRE